MSNHGPETTDRQSTAAALFARLWWMLVGNGVLALSAVFILLNTAGFFRAADVVFWCAAVSLVLVRYIDVRFLGGLTATGTAASMRHWIRYTFILAVCSVAVWALAHAANYFFVGR
jgi:hypothetical protein